MTDDRLLAAKKKFSRLLKEIFQFDCADLDFGIYRILAMRRTELERFLDDELLPQVEGILAAAAGDRVSVQSELSKLESTLRDAGIQDFSTSPKWNELKGKLAASPDVAALGREVFSDLTTFFARYYDEGDFMALPRYKGDTYAIPYDGSEVKLHWANADQYYIKTTEQHADYTAVIEGVSGLDNPRLRFRLAAAESDRDNNKSTEKRRYVLRSERPVEVEGSELTVWFEFRRCHDGEGLKKPKRGGGETVGTGQADFNKLAEREILACVPSNWQVALTKKALQNPEKYTVLGYQLYRYTKKNTSDYFIHKDLGGFLRRELDFFIKNEVLFLDDIEGRTSAEIDVALQKVKAIRAVGGKIIEWLAQIEDLQRSLYLKQKFVLRSHMIVSLDLLSEELKKAACANPEQVAVWKDTCGSEAASSEPCLPVDTRLFSPAFRSRVLTQLGGRADGVLINGDNAQAIRLCERRWLKDMDCIYLDPPYNTSEETFIYKNEYRHSSWLAMIAHRVQSAAGLIAEHGVLLLTIDDEEFARVKLVLDGVFGPDRFIGTIAVQTNPRGRGINSHFATSHDYIIAYALDPTKVSIADQPLTDEQRAGYGHGEDDTSYRLLPFRRSGGLSTPDERPNSEFALWYSPGTDAIVAIGGERSTPYPATYVEAEVLTLHAGQVQRHSVDEAHAILPSDVVRILPVDSKGQRRVWRWSAREKILKAAAAGDFVVKSGRNGDYSVQLKDFIKGGRKPKTMWVDSKYDGSSHGTNVLADILGSRRAFGYPKSIHATRDALHAIVGDMQEALVADFFGGSGTTAHAVLQLNDLDDGNRRFVVAEMGEYFESVTVPRVMRCAYSDAWKDGNPTSTRRVSYAISVITLESYDDTLENVTLQRDPKLGELFKNNDPLREDYTLRYMLNLEAEGSLLSLQRFRKPWDYTIKVRRDGVVQDSPVDLVETFNYLIGLRVRRYDTYDQEGLLFVIGTDPDGRRVIIVWRDCDLWPNDRLEEKCRQAFESFRPDEFDLVYVNGDNHLPIIKTGEESWKVNLIEETFHARMFDTSDVE